MFRILTSLWNYTILLKKIVNFYKLQQLQEISNYDIYLFVTKIIPNIQSCGCVCIKFCQWITPILDCVCNDSDEKPKWLIELEQFYEKCPNHDDKYTLEIYHKEFKEPLSKNYCLEDIIGSGSIGQVYKIKHKHTNKYYAMKILHPNVKYDMWLFKKIFILLVKFNIFKNIVHKYLPFNIELFLDLFEEQLNMIHEANNLCLMKHNNIKNNHIVKFPELIQISESILIMTYQPAKTIDDIDLSEYEKSKLFTLLYLFSQSSCKIDNFIHGDLHIGNWKINSDKQIQLYDFGYCVSVDNKIIKLLDDAVLKASDKKNNYQESIDLCIELFHLSGDIIKPVIHKYYDNIDKRCIADPEIFLNLIYSLCNELNLIVQPYIVQLLIILVQNNKYVMKYNINNKQGKSPDEHIIFKNQFINFCNICDTYNVFLDYKQEMIDTLNKEQVNTNELFDALDDSNFINNEIKSLLKFD